ncbi:unnamed protein product [Diamesa tonsa]
MDTTARCGSNSNQIDQITIEITKTTGGNFSVIVNSDITVENLKKIVSKKLKIAKERICFLNCERELQDGTLKENGIVNGSKIIVTPNVETGLAQRAENTVMQALESLNDGQVNDFLSGKSPLNLSVRLGDHMMLIQLQLSTLSPTQQNTLKQKVASVNALKAAAAAATRSLINCNNNNNNNNNNNINNNNNNNSTTNNFNLDNVLSSTSSGSMKRAIDQLGIDDAAPEKQRMRTQPDFMQAIQSQQHKNDDDNNQHINHQSPIKSLSSLVSGPIKTAVQNLNHNKLFNALYKTAAAAVPLPTSSALPLPATIPTDPISANLTSCLCKRLNIICNNKCDLHRASTSSSSSSTAAAARVVDEPCCSYINTQRDNVITPQVPVPNRSLFISRAVHNALVKPKHRVVKTQTTDVVDGADQTALNIDNPALAEASRNLTQTLRKLSKRVFTNKNNVQDDGSSTSGTSSRTRAAQSSSSSVSSMAGSSGAVIESMKHHGKGIYSGTFSGTLNPALQDKNGRPKRDISTIIHILNDLLSATPQCAKSGAKIFFEPTTSSGASTLTPSTGKFIKVKRHSSTRIPSSSSQKCTYGQCNGHTKTELNNKSVSMYSNSPSSSSLLSAVSNPSSSVRGGDCIECSQQQSLLSRKLELENTKTKNKMDQLRLVMQQKRERREARKLNATPYSVPRQHSPAITIVTAPISSPVIIKATKLIETTVVTSTSSTNLIANTTVSATERELQNTEVDATPSTSSSATATAIATSIAAQTNSEIENHMEEVDTVA